MAVGSLSSTFVVSLTHRASPLSPKSHSTNLICKSKHIQCIATTATIDHEKAAVNRRSANYPPSYWDYNFVKSLTSDYTEDKYVNEVDKLKNEVRTLIVGDKDTSLSKLELIDVVQRLGLTYHFEKEIKKAVDIIFSDSNDAWVCGDLYSTALRFRLLRQHGGVVPQDAFERFKDENGSFKASLSKDAKGVLSLCEASFFGFKGEDIIDNAKTFSTTHLMDIKETLSPIMWWVDLGLNKIAFARDRLVEHYFWCNGMAAQPQYEDFRNMGTKVICLITTIDDVCDVYGSLEELELFTDFVDRWDITEIDKLPNNITTVLLAMFNTTNDIGYWYLKERGFNIIPYLRKQWAYLCKAYLKEAHWFNKGYKPSLDEYLDNAVVSIAAPIMLFCSYFLTTDNITVEALNYIDKLPSIMRCSSMILRLANDLGTSSDELARGDNLKAVQCYMNETGATEEEARKYVDNLVHETWKTLNKDMLASYPFSDPFLTAIPNLGRIFLNNPQVYNLHLQRGLLTSVIFVQI